MTETMKRWELSAVGRANLRLAEAPVPQPGANEIRVKVGAASLNFRDKLVIDGTMPLPISLPFVPASDLAGTVEAVGPGVTRFRPGDRVVSTFFPDWIDGRAPGSAEKPSYRTLGGEVQGVLAERVVLHEDWAVTAPVSLDDAAASTLPVAGLTAWYALVERGNLKAGQTVLVQGTGGVSLFAVQIAAAHGATVLVTSSEDAKLTRAMDLGAHHGINRRTRDWMAEVHRLTGGHGADHVLEMAAGAGFGQSLSAMAVDGRVSVIGVLEGFDLSTPILPVIVKRAVIEGISVGHRRALEDLIRAVDRLSLKPVIDSTFAFDAVPQALARLDQGPFGKIVVQVG